MISDLEQYILNNVIHLTDTNLLNCCVFQQVYQLS